MEIILVALVVIVLMYAGKGMVSATSSTITATTSYKQFAPTITPQDALDAAFAAAPNPNPKVEASYHTGADYFPDYIVEGTIQPMINDLIQNGTCSSSSANNSGLHNLQLVQSGGKLALTSLSAAGTIAGVSGSVGAIGAVSAIAGPVGLIIGGIVGIFSIIAKHHAEAVAAEHQLECTLLPAAENYLQIIKQAVQNGQATPQDAIAALNSLVTDFRAQASGPGAPSFSSPYCNALCDYWVNLVAIANYYRSGYQAMIS